MYVNCVLLLVLVVLCGVNVEANCNLEGTAIYGPKWHVEYYDDGAGNYKSKEFVFSNTTHKQYEDNVLKKEYTCVSLSVTSTEIFFITSTVDAGNVNQVGMYYCIQIVDMSPGHQEPLVMLRREVEIGANPTAFGTNEASSCLTLFDYEAIGNNAPTVGANYFDDYEILVRVDDSGKVVDDSVAPGVCPDAFREAFERNVMKSNPDILLSNRYSLGYKITDPTQEYKSTCNTQASTLTLEGNIMKHTSCDSFPASYYRPLQNNDMKCLGWGAAIALRWTYDAVMILEIKDLEKSYFTCGRFRKVTTGNKECIRYSFDLTNQYKPTCKTTSLDDHSVEANNFMNLVDAETVEQKTANTNDPRPGYISFEICADDCDRNRCDNVANCTQSFGSYSCKCPAGYEGYVCEQNKDDCVDANNNDVCLNGGDCTDGIDSFTCSCNPEPGTVLVDGKGWRNGPAATCEIETCYIPDKFRVIKWFYKYKDAVDSANKVLIEFENIFTIAIDPDRPADTVKYDCERDTRRNGLWVSSTRLEPTTDKRICQEILYINLAQANPGDQFSSTDIIMLYRQEPVPAGSILSPFDPTTCNIGLTIAYNVLMPGSPVFATKTPFTSGMYYHIDWWTKGETPHCVGEVSNGKAEGNVIKPDSVCDKPQTVTAVNPIGGDIRVVYYWPSALMLDPNTLANGGAILLAVDVAGENEPTYFCGRYLEDGITVHISFNIQNQLVAQCFINAGAQSGDDTSGTFHIKMTSNRCEQTSPCQNGATCDDYENQKYRCVCPPGYTGDDCGTNINDCDPNKCHTEGHSSCDDGIDSYVCNCKAGWGHFPLPAPQHCDNQDWCYNHNDPLSSICIHGTCSETDANDGFKCTCDPGWTGTHCEIDINECASDPCVNGGTCTDTDETNVKQYDFYRCICPSGFEGTNCEKAENNCKIDPCVHGHCINYPGTDEKYYCDCKCEHPDATCSGLDTHYLGRNCDHLNECLRFPDYCKNGARCIDRIAGEQVCVCRAGYTGRQCDTVVESECNPNPCLADGICAERSDGVNPFMCTCNERRTGVRCEMALLTCEDDPMICENGGSCTTWTNGSVGYTCNCVTNYSGRNCETDDRPFLDDVGIALIACLCVLIISIGVIIMFCWCAQSNTNKGNKICC